MRGTVCGAENTVATTIKTHELQGLYCTGEDRKGTNDLNLSEEEEAGDHTGWHQINEQERRFLGANKCVRFMEKEGDHGGECNYPVERDEIEAQNLWALKKESWFNSGYNGKPPKTYKGKKIHWLSFQNNLHGCYTVDRLWAARLEMGRWGDGGGGLLKLSRWGMVGLHGWWLWRSWGFFTNCISNSKKPS